MAWLPHVHARRGCVGPLGDAEVHSDGSSIHLLPVHLTPGLRSVSNILVVDKSKAPAASTVTVQDHLALLQLSKPAELLVQLALSGVKAQPEHPQALVGLRLLPVPVMTPPR